MCTVPVMDVATTTKGVFYPTYTSIIGAMWLRVPSPVNPPPAYTCISQQLTCDADNVQSSRALIRTCRVTYQSCFDWHFSTHVNLAVVLSTVDLEIHYGGRRVLAFSGFLVS